MGRKKCPIPRRNLGPVRVRAIRARRSGMSCKDIAAAFGVSPVTVSRWIKKYNTLGAAGLKGKRSSGRPATIDCQEFFPKLKKIVKQPATRFGLTSPLWNSKRLRQVLASEYQIRISQSTMWRALKSIGLSYQKPERRAFEADDQARKIWLEEFWPNLKKRASKERAVILFEDEAAVSLVPNLGKTWAKIGRTPLIKLTGNRGSVSVISAISTTGKLYFKVPPGTVASAEFIEFLKQILTEIPRKKIYMILDGGSTHRSKMTKQFVLTQPRLQLVLLPAYSPDFNPDEFTWERLKRVEMLAHTQTTKARLRAKTLASMRSIQKKSDLVKSFIKRSKLT